MSQSLAIDLNVIKADNVSRQFVYQANLRAIAITASAVYEQIQFTLAPNGSQTFTNIADFLLVDAAAPVIFQIQQAAGTLQSFPGTFLLLYGAINTFVVSLPNSATASVIVTVYCSHT